MIFMILVGCLIYFCKIGSWYLLPAMICDIIVYSGIHDLIYRKITQKKD